MHFDFQMRRQFFQGLLGRACRDGGVCRARVPNFGTCLLCRPRQAPRDSPLSDVEFFNRPAQQVLARIVRRLASTTGLAALLHHFAGKRTVSCCRMRMQGLPAG
jgi:hypothetical protein